MMILEVKRLSGTARLPEKMTPGAACYDLYTDSEHSVSELQASTQPTTKVGTGIAVAIPSGHVGLVFSRSSAYSRGIELSNGVGVIDSDYRGEIFVSIKTSRYITQQIDRGERIAQLMIIKCESLNMELVDELSTSVRGSGGFGST